MTAAVFAFEADRGAALRLASALGCPCETIAGHTFPDGESLPRVGRAAPTSIVYRSLDRPDPKLMPLLLAADALKRVGAGRLVLVAPYLPYLRQDAVFHPGEPLSRDVLGGLLGSAFARLVTVEPHLHRTRDLAAVFAGREVSALSVAELFAQAIGGHDRPLIVGPDAESAPWAAAVAQGLGADWTVFHKQRLGDRTVSLALPDAPPIAGRRVALVDDICASGGTLEAAISELSRRGAAAIEVLVAHALFPPETGERLKAAGAARLVSTDSCAHPTNAIVLAPLLAAALREELTR